MYMSSKDYIIYLVFIIRKKTNKKVMSLSIREIILYRYTSKSIKSNINEKNPWWIFPYNNFLLKQTALVVNCLNTQYSDSKKGTLQGDFANYIW